jgi:hypothetical protein
MIFFRFLSSPPTPYPPNPPHPFPDMQSDGMGLSDELGEIFDFSNFKEVPMLFRMLDAVHVAVVFLASCLVLFWGSS